MKVCNTCKRSVPDSAFEWCPHCGIGLLLEAVAPSQSAITKDPTEISNQNAVAATSAPLDSKGAALIAAERLRQITAEGWSPEHDDAHVDGELLAAAACYLEFERLTTLRTSWSAPPPDWPWDRQWWKPSDHDSLKNLVRAGALIAAEIDRHIRFYGFADTQPANVAPGLLGSEGLTVNEPTRERSEAED